MVQVGGSRGAHPTRCCSRGLSASSPYRVGLLLVLACTALLAALAASGGMAVINLSGDEGDTIQRSAHQQQQQPATADSSSVVTWPRSLGSASLSTAATAASAGTLTPAAVHPDPSSPTTTTSSPAAVAVSGAAASADLPQLGLPPLSPVMRNASPPSSSKDGLESPSAAAVEADQRLDAVVDRLRRRFGEWETGSLRNVTAAAAQPHGRDGFDAWPIVLPVSAKFAGHPAAGGRLVGHITGFGTLYEAPVNPTCTSAARMFNTTPHDLAHMDAKRGRVHARDGWPWAWQPTAKWTLPYFCALNGRKREHLNSNRWHVIDRVEPASRRYWVLERVTTWKQGFFIAGDVFDRVVATCAGGGTADDVCSSLTVSHDRRSIDVHFGGYSSFEANLWPPLLYDTITVRPVGSPSENIPADVLRTAAEFDAAVWVPPSDFDFTYHLVNDLLLPTHYATRHRAAHGLPTAFFTIRPFATRFGFKDSSCYHGARRCLDEALQSSAGGARGEWRRLLLHMAGGRDALVGLDAADVNGRRAAVAAEFSVGQPTHCDTQSRSGGTLLTSLDDHLSAANVDCSRSWWEWRRLVQRFLEADGRLPAAAVLRPAVAMDERPRVVYLARRPGDARQLRGADAMMAALRAEIGTEGDVEEVVVTSLADTFEALTRATVLIVTHGAAMVNLPLLRANAGVVAIDMVAPPMMPYLPTWVHAEFARATCVEPKARSKECVQAYTLADFKLEPEQVARIVGAVGSILRRQRRTRVSEV